MSNLHLGIVAMAGASVLIAAAALGVPLPFTPAPPAAPAPVTEQSVEQEPASRPGPAPRRSVARRARASAPPATADDAATTAELRELGWTNPSLVLELVRAGNERFPGSPDAPERAWFEARALTKLARFDEARQVAERLVERYPDTRWARDVRRHLLSHPFGLPPRPRAPR